MSLSPRPIVFAYIDEPPFVSPGGGAWPNGFDAALAARVLKAMGIADATAKLVTFAQLLDGVAAGAWSFNTPLFISDERKKLVRFSQPVWGLADGLMMRSADAARFATYEQVAAADGARLGVVAGQVQAETARRAGIPDERVVGFATPEETVAALRAGAIAAYASVAMAHRGFLARNPDPGLAYSNLIAPEFSGAAGSAPALGAFSFACRPNPFADAFEEALSAFLGSPEHKVLAAKYGFTMANGLAAG
jgi:polar amino acid transport system substrate-binding protein